MEPGLAHDPAVAAKPSQDAAQHAEPLASEVTECWVQLLDENFEDTCTSLMLAFGLQSKQICSSPA